ncbi:MULTISPECIES: YgeY family selenium metabolism-linked hydrolase [Clostridium]|uniref:N-formyl-4-amino-5-aminomethyl-2-methylpyrimidine deformylase n=2 Tax=Clostridium TaxID=1485 RepID=D8GPG5_CLOLD|nr:MULTISPECIES: YgeY family selenium metabolism-linked hydrolase [Clostridium]ADK16043.1 putative deacetylase [Clostridium ljungdahlii DSM 13528]AGY75219.1 YgeY family selenium metabolism-linked hydrolase [Clostridium autoethanogenum DSM 10061]ALU35389.1 Peptidase M20 [Clostridium autoethanogenum DSM 10061]OAA87081.1 N-formyl-4-amino-5-aminomethyl-2-methylpyrimidine deformylase [Clostridium ljungdahlii DSM 13528]OVY49532.1 N-formyl-4-amino-5-aminomethyl-2-methylpyrimidine deformylase [Clostri
MLSEERKSEVIELCKKLIRTRSYSGQEENVANVIKVAFNNMGFDDFFIDDYGNIIGHIKGKEKGKSILFDGHMDTVPVVDESEWTYPPFAAQIHDGKMYGRGTSDMKGALCAMICGVSYFAKDVKKKFKGDIYVAGVVHEECFEGVASRKISAKVNPDYVVIGEASNCNLKIGQRGRAEILVETFGKSAHSANPEKGINAVYKMNKLIEAIRKLKLSSHDFLGDGILELTDIKSSPYPGASVVPDYCRATFDRRLLVGETRKSVLKPIQNIITELEKQDENFKAKVSFSRGKEMCYTGVEIEGERFFPAWLYDRKDEFVKKSYDGLVKAGINPEITHYSFCTNGSHYAGEAGIKAIGFGPSKENLAHTVNEYIEISQFEKAVEGYYSILKAVLS